MDFRNGTRNGRAQHDLRFEIGCRNQFRINLVLTQFGSQQGLGGLRLAEVGLGFLQIFCGGGIVGSEGFVALQLHFQKCDAVFAL